MTEKKDIKVVIDGKVLTMSGYESEDYMQKVASYINNKISEYEKIDFFKHASKDIQHRLIEVNIADDYHKVKRQLEEMETEMRKKEEELYEIKHDSVNKDMMIEDTKEKLKKAQNELHENAKQIVQLQTELKERNKEAKK
ncbi:MAG TPA: cell division protein ZapA [Lachnospiraceae bacterium]|nr:cell division protein ZapA [Lachnospiraceae bacterium]